MNISAAAEAEYEIDSALDDSEQEAVEHVDNADPIVDPQLVKTRPGRIKTKGSFTLHTQLAHRLFYGRRKGTKEIVIDGKPVKKKMKPVIGLVRFATNVNQIFELAAMDDPYADFQLIKIEEGLQTAKELTQKNVVFLEQLLGDVEGMSIEPSFSVEPVKLPLEFQTPFFGFEAARIIKSYDKLVLLALTTRQTGDLLSDDWDRIVNKTASKIRSAFLLSAGYRFAGATRNDFAANNERARAAIQKYGELPQDVLEGKKRAKHAPKIRKS